MLLVVLSLSNTKATNKAIFDINRSTTAIMDTEPYDAKSSIDAWVANNTTTVTTNNVINKAALIIHIITDFDACAFTVDSSKFVFGKTTITTTILTAITDDTATSIIMIIISAIVTIKLIIATITKYNYQQFSPVRLLLPVFMAVCASFKSY